MAPRVWTADEVKTQSLRRATTIKALPRNVVMAKKMLIPEIYVSCSYIPPVKPAEHSCCRNVSV